MDSRRPSSILKIVFYNKTFNYLIILQPLKIFLKVKPYEGIVDLFILDPDGYVVRKWNSKELNVGVIEEQFELPEYPKVCLMPKNNYDLIGKYYKVVKPIKFSSFIQFNLET